VDWNEWWTGRCIRACSVAPLAGAWIETTFATDINNRGKGRAPRGRVDWNTTAVPGHAWLVGRAPRGRVDWNMRSGTDPCPYHGRAPRGRVDWNFFGVFVRPFLLRRAPRGRVDWNIFPQM